MAKFEIKDGVCIIPEGTTSIPQEAFKNETDLVDIYIPDSVTSIGNLAFDGCTGLKSIGIGENIHSIGLYAFRGCSNIEGIVVSEDNQVFDSRQDCDAIIESDTNTLLVGCKNTVIPDSVEKIGSSAFEDCTGLTSINIPRYVNIVSSDAFKGCTGLTSITVDEFNRKYDSRDNCNAIIKTEIDMLAVGCKNTTIPDSVTMIGQNAFRNCASLNSISLPGSVTTIDDFSFAGCTNLTNIVIPDSVTKIGKQAFDGCRSLKSIILPESLTTIISFAFMNCTELKSIVIPKSVKDIGIVVFGGCSDLTSLAVAEGNERYDSRNNCNAIIETATNKLIAGCKGTIIPDSITSIDQGAFLGCTSITHMVIPETVSEIGSTNYFPEGTFESCSGLVSVVIQAKIKAITSNLFMNCSSLESVTLPAGIGKIADDAFVGCTALKTINVPAKKADYYKKRLPENLHNLIAELPAEKKK